MVSDTFRNHKLDSCISLGPCMLWLFKSASCCFLSQSLAERKLGSRILFFSFQILETPFTCAVWACSERDEECMSAALHLPLHQHHHSHLHLGLPHCQAYSHLWVHRCVGVGSMTCLCATAQWAATATRPWSWWLSWRRRPEASAASCSTGTTVQGVQRPQSSARPWKTATSALCSSRLTSCRMSGASTWCIRLWPRDLCPIGSSRCIRTFHSLTILGSFASSARST